MGDRCVITTCDVTKENQDKKLGVYLHWCGPREDVEKILSECKKKEIRSPEYDYSYFWARFCQIAANYCGAEDTTGIGIDIVSRLDVNNFDNGVYYIDDDFNIARQTDGSELLLSKKSEEEMSEKYIKLSDVLRLVTESICDLEYNSDKDMFIEEINKLEIKEIKEK